MNSSSRLFYTSPAKSFHEILPLGNGFFGAAAYSGTDSDRYSPILPQPIFWATGARCICRSAIC